MLILNELPFLTRLDCCSLSFYMCSKCHSGYLNGEATIRYVLATKLHIDVVVPGIIQGVQDVEETVLLDYIDVNDFTAERKRKEIIRKLSLSMRTILGIISLSTDLPCLLVILQVTAPSPASRASTFRWD